MFNKKLMPKSPHLSEYNIMTISSGLSIIHRITGVISVFSIFIMIGIMILHYFFPDFFFFIKRYSILNYLITTIIALYSCSVIFHIALGIRHFLIDMGYFLDIRLMRISGYTTLAFTVIFCIVYICYLFFIFPIY